MNFCDIKNDITTARLNNTFYRNGYTFRSRFHSNCLTDDRLVAGEFTFAEQKGFFGKQSGTLISNGTRWERLGEIDKELDFKMALQINIFDKIKVHTNAYFILNGLRQLSISCLSGAKEKTQRMLNVNKGVSYAIFSTETFKTLDPVLDCAQRQL